MPRAKNKDELIESAKKEFETLQNLLNTISSSDANKEFIFPIHNRKEAHWTRDRNMRDVLIHLYEWHQLLLVWVEKNLAQQETPFIPLPYNWKTYGKMNQAFVVKHQDTSYDASRNYLLESHHKVMALIDEFSNEELFKKGVFKWTGVSALGAFFISNTASHYNWATKKIKMHVKTLNS